MRVRVVLVPLVVLGVLACSLSADAQTPPPITSYTFKYYNVGAPQPVSMFTMQATAVLCDQVQPQGTSVNPNTIYWDDTPNSGNPGHAGKFCVWRDPGITGQGLLGVPIGAFEGTLLATNSVGDGPESARVPFQKAAVPAAPTNVRLVR